MIGITDENVRIFTRYSPNGTSTDEDEAVCVHRVSDGGILANGSDPSSRDRLRPHLPSAVIRHHDDARSVRQLLEGIQDWTQYRTRGHAITCDAYRLQAHYVNKGTLQRKSHQAKLIQPSKRKADVHSDVCVVGSDKMNIVQARCNTDRKLKIYKNVPS